MTDKAEQIAAGLTEAQRERLLGPENTGVPAGVAGALIRHGLVAKHPTDPEGWAWSHLGLAVRKILIRESQS
jgi:hypothetical protein